MKPANKNQTLFVLLSCGFGVAAAVLHWLIPTRFLLGNVIEYICAAVAACCCKSLIIVAVPFRPYQFSMI